MLDDAVRAVEMILKDGVAKAMNEFNRKVSGEVDLSDRTGGEVANHNGSYPDRCRWKIYRHGAKQNFAERK